MKVMLVGGHQKANFLTRSLKKRGHQVTIINGDYEWCQFLSNTHDVVAVHGDGSKPFILADAGADEMDTVIALGNKDASNLLVCELAKKQFHVSRTIAIVNDPKNVEIFKKLGVSKCISATQMIADIIEHETVQDAICGYSALEGGKILFCEMVLDGSAVAIGERLSDLALPKDSTIACIVRNGYSIIPNGDTVLLKSDKLILLVSAEHMDEASAVLLGKQK